jgi:hypothetical protein
MNLRRALTLTAAMLLLATVALGGHELPVYPSYYPHEIEIAALAPVEAGEQLGKGKLHAYVGGAPVFAGAAPKDIAAVPSLGSLVVVKLNRGSPLAGDAAAACAVIGAVVRELAAKGGDVIAHAYPITPLHGDYLHHADLAQAAMARIGAGASSPAAPAPGLGVRAEGPLAENLVRPEWRTDRADWDAEIREVDAGQLAAAATTATNGWMGPRWVRSGWFQAYQLLADTVADPEARQRVEADVARLQSGDIADAAERANLERELVRRLTAGCRGAVAGYTLKREYFNASFSDGIENIAYGALEGLNTPMFLRTVKLKDFPWNGWLRLGTPAPPHAAWNPVGGFTDDFGRLMWSAVGDPADMPSPYGHDWVLNRISEVEETPKPRLLSRAPPARHALHQRGRGMAPGKPGRQQHTPTSAPLAAHPSRKRERGPGRYCGLHWRLRSGAIAGCCRSPQRPGLLVRRRRGL